jgi:hypothetical protein
VSDVIQILQSDWGAIPGASLLSGFFYNSVSQRKTPQSESFSINTDTRGNIRLYRAHESKLLEL